MASKAHWLKKGVAMLLPCYLLALSMAGCAGAASSSSPAAISSSSSAASSFVPSSSSVVTSVVSAASVVPASSLPYASSLPPAPTQSLPSPTTQATALLIDDFSAYLAGTPVVAPADVAFQRFSFAQNAVWHRLDAKALTTKRGLLLGSTPQDIIAQYGGLPVDIRSLNETGSWVSQRHSGYEEFLQMRQPPTNYYVVVFQYFIEGTSATPAAAAEAIAANALGSAHQVHRYEIIFHMRTGTLADIFLSLSNTTPYTIGTLATYGPVLETDGLTVSLNGLFTSPESFGLYLGLHNGYNQPLTAVCKTTMVSGKATRDVALLQQSVPAVGYADALLEIPNDTAHAAGIERVDSISFTIELRNAQGHTVHTSAPITASFTYPEEALPA